ncbi:MAG TPA: hypothetical protein VK045_07290 [Ornithinicoccus sp.]|nr:hypothetical protein [Ornithinicoccus sp.]
MPKDRSWRRPAAHLAVTLAWGVTNLLAWWIEPSGTVLAIAVAVHLLAVVISLGPIVLLDWYGLVWIAGLRRLRAVTAVTQTAHPLIWTGLLLLLVSGAFLDPDYAEPMTWVKQVMVLVLLHNGLALRPLERLLGAQPHDTTLETIPTALRRRMMGATMTSQIAWWAAFGIGVLVMLTRRTLV